MTPYEAIERVRMVVERNENISVIGVAGPGDPLANDATFDDPLQAGNTGQMPAGFLVRTRTCSLRSFIRG
jgi:hypothetical protein